MSNFEAEENKASFVSSLGEILNTKYIRASSLKNDIRGSVDEFNS